MTRPARAESRAQLIVVWALWGAMLVVALVCIALYGRNIPLAEDWTMVAALTGNEPILGAWLWSQINEHRLPLPRLIYLTLLELGGGDFRVGMVFNTLLVAALAAGLMLTARSARGRTVLADAFFPLALLHLGHWINLFWGWQIQFVMTVALMVVLLIACVRQQRLFDWKAGGALAATLVMLPFTGAGGLIVVAAMSPWVALTALAHLRGERDVRGIGVLLLAALAMVVATGTIYFVGYERPSWNPPSPSHLATVQTGLGVLALGFGPAVERAWWLGKLGAIVMLAPLAWLTIRAVLRERGIYRLRAVGLMLFGAALLGLSLGIGFGRAALLPTFGLPVRYALLALPALCATYFAWQLYGSPRAAAGAHAALALLAAMLLPWNTRSGLGVRDWYLRNTAAVERDIAAGEHPATIARRHGAFLMHWDEGGLAARIGMLRDARLGPFGRLPSAETGR